MKRQYHYLIASLPELLSGEEYKNHPMPEFLTFCAEELDPADLVDLKKCFIFNNIENLCRQSDQPLKEPCLYGEEDLEEGRIDPEYFVTFIQEALYEISSDAKDRSAVEKERTLINALFEDVDDFVQGFPADYIRFELLARNIGTALAYRATNQPYATESYLPIIFSERIAVSPAPDFGLGGEIVEFMPVLDAFRKQQPAENERAFDEIRWNWLDERIGHDLFSADAVSGYAVKLSIVERWLSRDPEEGRRMLDRLIDTAGERAASMIHEQLEV